MNKGKQWKWSKKIRKDLEKQGAEPLKINTVKSTTDIYKEIVETTVDSIFSQIMELIKRCYLGDMPMDFLLEQVIELRNQFRKEMK